MSADLPHVIFNAYAFAAGTKYRRLFLQGYKYVDIWVRVSGVTGSPSSGTFDVKVQTRMPYLYSAATDYLDVPGKAITQVAYNASFPIVQKISLTEADISSGVMRLVMVGALGGGSSPKFTTTMQYYGRR